MARASACGAQFHHDVEQGFERSDEPRRPIPAQVGVPDTASASDRVGEQVEESEEAVLAVGVVERVDRVEPHPEFGRRHTVGFAVERVDLPFDRRAQLAEIADRRQSDGGSGGRRRGAPLGRLVDDRPVDRRTLESRPERFPDPNGTGDEEAASHADVRSIVPQQPVGRVRVHPAGDGADDQQGGAPPLELRQRRGESERPFSVPVVERHSSEDM